MSGKFQTFIVLRLKFDFIFSGGSNILQVGADPGFPIRDWGRQPLFGGEEPTSEADTFGENVCEN